MGEPDLPSERWDEAEDQIRYPHATRRRALIARSLGAFGILATLGLAAAAFAPRLSRAPHWLRATWSDHLAPAAAPTGAQPPVIVQQIPTAHAPTVAAPAPPLPPVSEATPPLAARDAIAEPSPAAQAEAEAPVEPSAAAEPSPAAQAAPRSAPVRTASSSRRSRSEVRLTPRQIEQRQQRYEMWLRREGLERIH